MQRQILHSAWAQRAKTKSIIECWTTYRKNPIKNILPTQYALTNHDPEKTVEEEKNAKQKVRYIILCSQPIHCSNVPSIETKSSVFCEKYAILHFLLRCRTSNSDCFRVSLHDFYSMARADTVEEHFFGTRHAISNSCAKMSSSYYFAAFLEMDFHPFFVWQFENEEMMRFQSRYH